MILGIEKLCRKDNRENNASVIQDDSPDAEGKYPQASYSGEKSIYQPAEGSAWKWGV